MPYEFTLHDWLKRLSSIFSASNKKKKKTANALVPNCSWETTKSESLHSTFTFNVYSINWTWMFWDFSCQKQYSILFSQGDLTAAREHMWNGIILCEVSGLERMPGVTDKRYLHKNLHECWMPIQSRAHGSLSRLFSATELCKSYS